jgi:hypothetical protein
MFLKAHFNPEDEGDTFLQNGGSKPRRPHKPFLFFRRCNLEN